MKTPQLVTEDSLANRGFCVWDGGYLGRQDGMEKQGRSIGMDVVRHGTADTDGNRAGVGAQHDMQLIYYGW